MANSNFKTEYGLLVAGDTTLNGNVVVQANSVVTTNTILAASNSSVLGAAASQFNLVGNTGSFSNTLTVTGNLAVNSTAFTVSSGTGGVRVSLNAAATGALLTVGGTVNVAGNTAIANVVTVSGNTTIGTNTLFVSTASGSERVGIKNDASNTLYSLAVGGNTAIVDGQLIVTNGYIQTNQLKINNSGGLQLGENVAFTFAGSIVGDILPAYATGTFSANTTASNNVVTLNGANTAVLAPNYVVVQAGVFAANTRVLSIINATAFSITSAALTTNTNLNVTYYSNYDNGSLATYSLGSLSNLNKRWEVFAKNVTVTSDVVMGGTLTVANGTATHTVAGNVAFDTNTLYIDAANNKVGINQSVPAETLSVVGTTSITANAWVTNNTLVISSNSTVSQANVTGRMYVSGNVVVNNQVLVVVSNTTTSSVSLNSTATDALLTVGGTANVAANANFGNTVFIAGNTRIGNTTSYVNIKTDGALRVTKELEIGNTGIYSNSATIATAGANTLIDTSYTNEYDASKYIVSYHSTSNTQVFGATELLLVHNGTSVVTTEYATVFNANIAFSIDASIPSLSTNCNIYASANQGNLAVTITRISML